MGIPMDDEKRGSYDLLSLGFSLCFLEVAVLGFAGLGFLRFGLDALRSREAKREWNMVQALFLGLGVEPYLIKP